MIDSIHFVTLNLCVIITELRGRRPRLVRRVGTRLSFHRGLPRRVPRPGRVLVPQAERSLVVSSSPTSDTSQMDVDARQEGSRRSGLDCSSNIYRKKKKVIIIIIIGRNSETRSWNVAVKAYSVNEPIKRRKKTKKKKIKNASQSQGMRRELSVCIISKPLISNRCISATCISLRRSLFATDETFHFCSLSLSLSESGHNTNTNF